MAQIESPDALAQLPQPHRLMMQILIGTGLRSRTRTGWHRLHQLRHTYGTRLINADDPQEVFRRLLDHESSEMTARYARLSDQTIRRHWERARKVNIHGETVALEQGSPLSDAAWMKEILGRAMAVPTGTAACRCSRVVRTPTPA